MKYQIEMEIDLPREKVIGLFDNPDYFKQWQPSLLDCKPLSGVAGQQGAKTELVHKMGSRSIKMTETVISRNFPDTFEVTYETPKVWNHVVNEFEEVSPTRTRWRAINEFKCSGFMAILAFFSPGTFRKETRKSMNFFKEFAERNAG